MCKEIGQDLATRKHAQLLSNPVAVQLGLDDPNGPATVLAQAMEQLNGGTNVVYMYLLDACEKVFAGDLDQVSFEEHMRWFFGNKARMDEHFFIIITDDSILRPITCLLWTS